MKKSKVTSVQANGTWESQYGLFFKHEVSFENGDSGEYSTKSENQNKFIIGEETEYEFIDGKFPKVKPINTFDQKSFKEMSLKFNSSNTKDNVQEYIVKQSSLKCATDYIIANGGDQNTIIDIAEIFSNWVLKGEKPTESNTNLPF
jgi:hypothetical protein